MTAPTDEQALQFCIMLQAGLPVQQAILYFIDGDIDASDLALMIRRWQRSKAVSKAQARLMGKTWQDMTLDERCRYALDQHYSALAYLLFSTHYADVGSTDKAKLDSARSALEAKLAGTAGKGDALSQFMDDFRTGKVKLARPPVSIPLPSSES